ncbi:unnamed protein product, partial [Ixodes persulcatus]
RHRNDLVKLSLVQRNLGVTPLASRGGNTSEINEALVPDLSTSPSGGHHGSRVGAIAGSRVRSVRTRVQVER